MAHTLYIESDLITMLIKHFNLHWMEDDENGFVLPFLVYEDGSEFFCNDHLFLEIPTTEIAVEETSIQLLDETIKCDGILFFGDGCMEFHSAEDEDAYHWDNFTDESIKKITEIVAELVENA